MTCSFESCTKSLDERNRTGRCVAHPISSASPDRVCANVHCEINIRLSNKSGYCRAHIPKTKEQSRASNLKYFYGLTEDDLEEIIRSQNNLCALCSDVLREYGGVNGPHIDHDHRCCSGYRSCGLCIRGVVCAPCNKAVGWFENKDISYDELFAYIEWGKKVPTLKGE